MKRIYAVVLAAGLSERLGTNKLLLNLDGEPLIRRAVSPLLIPRVEKVLVVIPPENGHIRQALKGLAVEFVVNGHFREGMGSSVRAASPFLKGCDGALFHLADKPLITSTLVDVLIKAFNEGAGSIVVPVSKGEKGHPVLVDTVLYRDEIAQAAGDRGLRDVIEKEPGHVICIEGEEGCVIDIDTPDDVASLRRMGFTVEESQG